MLTPIQSFRGAKSKHSTTLCRCDCGEERLVRTSKLRLGLVTMCATCARREAAKRGGVSRSLPAQEAKARERFGIYIANARRRGLEFELSFERATQLMSQSCRYCGETPAGGIDRMRNDIGYTHDNSASCCSLCNYAKREMSVEQFLEWARKINDHQGVLQRNRSLLLRVAEQSHGRGPDNARGDR